MNQGTAQILAQLANTLGTTTKYLWAVEVKESYVMAIVHLVWILTLGIIIILSINMGKRSIRKAIEEREMVLGHDFEWTVGAFIYGLIAIACLIFIAFNLTSVISCLINPQDYAFGVIASAL